MRFLAILLFSVFLCSFDVNAEVSNGGHQISIQLTNYDEPQLFLGYHYGDKQYLQDTVEKNDAGFFVFEGEEPLPPGVYLVVMAPDNKYFQLLVTNEEQNFKVFVNAENPTRDIRFENAPDNQLFYEYLSFLEEKKPLAGWSTRLTVSGASALFSRIWSRILFFIDGSKGFSELAKKPKYTFFTAHFE